MSRREAITSNRTLLIGLIMSGTILAIALLGPLLLPGDPNDIDVRNRFAGPSLEHPLGTDELGRDTLLRLIYGARMSLTIAFFAMTIATFWALTFGLIVGYLGGPIDVVGMRVNDLFFAIPTLLIAVGIVALFGASATTTMLALGIAYIPFYTRLVRGAVVSVRSRPYVDASRVLGARGARLVRVDILPAILPIALVHSTAILGWALVDEAALGFLGLGVQPPDASWGSMINSGRQFIFQAPWLTIIPGIAVIVSVFAINLVGDGLRDYLDPRSSTRVAQAGS